MKTAAEAQTVAVNADGYADIDAVIARAMRAWRPPPRLTLSEWADAYFRLSAESAAEPGRWTTLPYQRGIADAITDPRVEQVSVMKSARVGYTLLISAAVGYYIHQDPTSILLVQPTVEDAKEYSKETIAPMLRDVPVLSRIIFKDGEEKGPKDSSATILHKSFPGGVLSMIGANSGSGFRRKSRRVVIFDEVDAYPPSAGSEGDQIELGIKRTKAFFNRKIVAGSTPLVAGSSRIEELFEQGDQRRYYVPCPYCGHMDFMSFRERQDGRGHWMQWPEGKPEEAHFVCRKNWCVIEHRHKRSMIERGEWRADRKFSGHASFHLWSALSYAPNSTWADLAKDFLKATKGGPEKLRTFVNTELGETWTEKGEAPDYLRLYQRRERYERGVVPDGVRLLTCGVDVQHNRLVYEVVGWGEDRQSWSVDAGEIQGNTATEAPWLDLDELLATQWPRADGGTMAIRVMAVDSGDQTQTVYGWCKQKPMTRVIAIKGVASEHSILGAASPVDVTVRGKKFSKGYRVWRVGSAAAKEELYGWLQMDPPTVESGEPLQPGFCHFSENVNGEEFFKQLTAEHQISVRKKNGYTVREFAVQPGRENHALDCRVYARAAAVHAGLEKMAAAAARKRRAEAKARGSHRVVQVPDAAKSAPVAVAPAAPVMSKPPVTVPAPVVAPVAEVAPKPKPKPRVAWIGGAGGSFGGKWKGFGRR